jgi:hypothetical protein
MPGIDAAWPATRSCTPGSASSTSTGRSAPRSSRSSRRWPDFGLDPSSDFTAREAVASIVRITGGNLRLTRRLMARVQRILQINELQTVTREVVEAARETLVLGVL